MFDLKPLSSLAVPAALAKAERYRLLNEPEQAESICEDVLRTEPDNAQAMVTLLLALTDRFSTLDGKEAARARALAAALPSDYERAYYAGLVAERRGRALLGRGGPGRNEPAGGWLQQAMGWYERAEEVRPAGNDDARLRWNACARVLNAQPHLMLQDQERGTPVMLE